jgi:hypothetical protein
LTKRRDVTVCAFAVVDFVLDFAAVVWFVEAWFVEAVLAPGRVAVGVLGFGLGLAGGG